MCQTKLHTFTGFTKSLSKLTEDKIYDGHDAEEAMALTAIDISKSVTLSENTNLRNVLQKDVGPLSDCASDGRSVAQIRRAKRQRRLENQAKLTAAQPLDHTNFMRQLKSTHDLEPIINSPIGKNDNLRWNNNRLYEATEAKNDNAIVSTSSVLTIEGVAQEQPAESLRKKVIQQLINVQSPKNECKKRLFQMLVKNEDNIKMIIDMAIEMGSSVEDTVTMLMNNCV